MDKEDQGRKVDCRDCGFYSPEDGMCEPVGFDGGVASELNCIDMYELDFFGEKTMVNHGVCEINVTPDAARLLRAGGVMKCTDCIHHDLVRGFQVCFVDGTPQEPYSPIEHAEFTKEPYERQCKVILESLGFECCPEYVERPHVI